MKRISALIAFVAATPALAHPSMVPHEHGAATAFSPAAGGVAFGLVALVVLVAPRLRAAMSRVTTR